MKTLAIGMFTEVDVEGVHTYAENTGFMTRSWDFPHVLHTFDGIRYARIEDKVACQLSRLGKSKIIAKFKEFIDV